MRATRPFAVERASRPPLEDLPAERRGRPRPERRGVVVLSKVEIADRQSRAINRLERLPSLIGQGDRHVIEHQAIVAELILCNKALRGR